MPLPRVRQVPHTVTFAEWPLDTLPPRPSQCDDSLQWLAELPVAKYGTGGPNRAAADAVLANHPDLPESFRVFLSKAEPHQHIESVTAGWINLATFDLGADGFLILFLRDQQDCATWLLQLRPDGTSRVLVATDGDLDEWYEAEEPASWVPPAGWMPQLRLCADSFTDFVFHYALEGALWVSLHEKPPRTFSPLEAAYAVHYTGDASDVTPSPTPAR